MKTDLNKCNKLLEAGYSLLTVGDNKIPNFAWQKRQKEQYTLAEFKKDYEYRGGIKRKDDTEIPATKGVGIVTGYNNVEVFDIDLKVFNSLKEQQDFWNEYTSLLRDNIDEFDKKFVIYKTMNGGYHILYKCRSIQGNLKIAKLKGMTEAVIETRGIGGYVFIYDNQISKLSYTEIQEISDLDRDVLFECSKFYNYVEEIDVTVKEETKDIPNHVEVTTWDDYNDKTNVLDLLADDFIIVRNLADKYLVKRYNATSAHSGYVYKNSGCVYLFSTGTIYPSEKLLSAFSIYTYKYCNGDYKSSAKELYKKGFGSRRLHKPEQLNERPVIEDVNFPLDIFPEPLQNYILQCHDTLDSSIDYMGCSMLWVLSVIVGNSIKIEVKTGWQEAATLWISVVGKAGIGKTPSINNIVFPLNKANNQEIKKFQKENEKYHAYAELDKKEKETAEKVNKPRKTQFIVDDVTLEALVDMHEENKNSVGIFKDELAGWYKDMNKYRAGSDMEFWLSTWSGKSVALNRKSVKSSFIEQPLIPVLGGIQPGILDNFYTEENKDNGFIDRMLLCYPDLIVDDYNDAEMHPDILQWYSDYIIAFYDNVKRHIIQYNNEDEIEPLKAVLSPDAKKEWIRIFNSITSQQNSDEENEYMKSMLPKQKSYIPRFALLINTLTAFNKAEQMSDFIYITKESILAAERLSDYFIRMAKKIKVTRAEVNELKSAAKGAGSAYQRFESMYAANPKFNRKEAAEILGISRKTLYQYLEKIEKSVT
jgi:hypothetical protein